MLIERTKKEIIIRLSANLNVDDIQAFINYVRYMEITSNSKVSQNDVNSLANEVNEGWWEENKKRFVK